MRIEGAREWGEGEEVGGMEDRRSGRVMEGKVEGDERRGEKEKKERGRERESLLLRSQSPLPRSSKISLIIFSKCDAESLAGPESKKDIQQAGLKEARKFLDTK